MSNLFEHIKTKTVKTGNVYRNNDGHHLIITDVCFYQNKYKSYPIFDKLLHYIFKPKPISIALNWTFTVKYQERITYTDGEEIKGLSSSSIMDVDYEDNSYLPHQKKDFKNYKEYEKYESVDTEFPTSPLIKDKRKKKTKQ